MQKKHTDYYNDTIGSSGRQISIFDMDISCNITQPCSYNSLRITHIDSIGSEQSFTWLINDHRYHPECGDFILFSATDLRMPIMSKNIPDVHITTIVFDPLTIFPNTELVGLYYLNSCGTKLIPKDSSDLIKPLFDRVVNEVKSPDGYSEAAAAAALKLLLIEFCRIVGYTYQNKLSQSSIELMGSIIAYLGSHFTEKLTVVSVAREFAVSTSLLSKLMNNMFGISFPEYVRRLRVNNVIFLTREKQMNILDAAFESGFASITGFYKAFHDITGTSPSEMLKSENF